MILQVRFTWLPLFVLGLLTVTGCMQRQQALKFSPDCSPCQTSLQQIEYPQLDCDDCIDGTELLAATPITLSNFRETEPLELTVDQCVEMALANSKVMQKLGGVVVSSPQAATTLYDQAIQETSQAGPEAALSAFDAQLNTSFTYNRAETFSAFPLFGSNGAFQGFNFGSQVSNTSNFLFEVNKQTASGARFAIRNRTDYRRTNPASGLFPSQYDMVNELEFRQPLARGRGTMVNRIAGPNAVPGQYNGVLIGRIRSDISLADFEASVRNLVRDVELNYWELYFSYRDLDTKLAARDSARKTWENNLLRLEGELARPDEEAQARQQYYNFQAQAQNALAGLANGQTGVLGAERNLRRLMGLPTSDGKLIRPISEPTVAPVSYDWDSAQMNALSRRVEIRRQKWTIRQRELELCAAKALNRWSFDLVGNYGARGFGDNLFGSRSRPAGSAFDSLIGGDLDQWQLGVELGGAIGNRQGHLAVRNAELGLVRDRTLLKEQQRQILHDLNAAYTEVDRALANVRTAFNSRIAAKEEIEPKRKRVEVGQDQVFFLLDAEQRVATAESAVHRAIADYNRALANFEYVAGNMLPRYNITLTEGPWCDDAQQKMYTKAPRFEKRGPNQCVDVNPVSMGVYDQSGGNLRNAEYITAPGAVMQPAESIEPTFETRPESDGDSK